MKRRRSEHPRAGGRIPAPGVPGVYLEEVEVELGGRRTVLLTASMVDILAARGPGERAYWAAAWPAGLALARHLAARHLGGRRALELGCGVGITALGAAIGGAEVLATDNEPPALRVTLWNARRNGLRLRAVAADWRAWPVRGRYDLIVGSDVTYEPALFPPLLGILDQCLAPGGEALFTDPGRSRTDAFLREAAAAGWMCESRPLPAAGRQQVYLRRLAARNG